MEVLLEAVDIMEVGVQVTRNLGDLLDICQDGWHGYVHFLRT